MTWSMPNFAIARPRDIESAISAREQESSSLFLAGGTDLLVNLRLGLGRPKLLIDLSTIDALREKSLGTSGMRIGACTSLMELTAMPAIRQRYRALAEAAEAVASPTTRSIATLGGNLCLQTRCVYYNQSEWWRRSNNYCLKHEGDVCHVAPQGQRCHAAFSGDIAPALMVLDAEAEIAGGNMQRRRVKLADFYREDGRAHLALEANEILVRVHLPSDPPPSSYAKARVRGAIDFPLAGVAVALAVDEKRLLQLRVGITGTNSRPFLLQGVDALFGHALDADALHYLETLVQKQVQPMRTTTISAHYRRLAAAALVRRLTTALAATPDETGEKRQE
jgi:4-hydroxybenzoyl-CoA reductase subunit beta